MFRGLTGGAKSRARWPLEDRFIVESKQVAGSGYCRPRGVLAAGMSIATAWSEFM
jgi:hypothetical protein